jgi:hypothetical protein
MKMSFTPPSYIRLSSSKSTDSVSKVSATTTNSQNSPSNSLKVELSSSEICSQSSSSITHEFMTYFHKIKGILKNWKKRPNSSTVCEAKRRALQAATIPKPIPLNHTTTNYHSCSTDSHSLHEISFEKDLSSHNTSRTLTIICDKGLFLSVHC